MKSHKPQSWIAAVDIRRELAETEMKIWRKFGDTGYRCCDDCAVPKPAGPMLYDSLWRTIIRDDWPWLCFDCTETRLGRPLTQADLKPCPYNAGWMPFDSADVVARQFARRRGRRLLPVPP